MSNSKKIPSGKTAPKLAEKPVVKTEEVTAFIHPPNLPLKPYLDNIWDVLHGYSGSIGDIEADITDIEADILDIQTNCCNEGGGGGSQNLFSNIPVSGQTTVTADSPTTALTLVAGSNMTITTDNTTKAITFASSGGGITNIDGGSAASVYLLTQVLAGGGA